MHRIKCYYKVDIFNSLCLKCLDNDKKTKKFFLLFFVFFVDERYGGEIFIS